MDSFDIFATLSAGVKFNKNKYKKDADRFHLGSKKQSTDDVKIKIEKTDNENVVSSKKRKIQEVEDESNDENDDKSFNKNKQTTLTLLDGMTVPSDGSKIKKKKKKIMNEVKILQQEKEKINEFRNKNRISVVGRQVPKPIDSFDKLSESYNVSNDLIENIKNCGYKVPTPIQMQAIPILLEKRQTLACAPTGSGKTASFLIPIIHHLKEPKKLGFRALIISPSRELAKQTYHECIRLSEGRDFRVHTISKPNQAMTKYGPNSSQKFDILITPPKRLLDLLNHDPPAISLKNIEWLVIDEADKLFEDGKRSFREQINEIINACTNEKLCTVMFSATNTAVVAKWCRHNLKSLINVTIGQRNAAAEDVDQQILFVGSERGKLVAMRNIINEGMAPPVLIFVQSTERAEELFKELIYDGINVDTIHSERTPTQRDNVVRCFREGKIWVLICSEVMARGIDFKGVNLVINYDFPPSAISYVHRIGRTGRAGHKGKAITFFTEQDTINLRSIAAIMKASGCEVPEYMLAMKKWNKRDRKKKELETPKRASISTIVKFKNKRQRIADAMKQKSETDKVKSNKLKNKLNDKNRKTKTANESVQKTKKIKKTVDKKIKSSTEKS
ncbi:hypothetical protein HCN44_004125 [Aphidius gifuensis]|uniref:Probable ATP-dependent RNA helicase DDX52 n=1 Tax=Aphidius gifuensis TaxID=684658 RepID=A0A835CUS8_APHGI|nr:probable ATP-dependent RNA helicase DDX52 [Aphidius gifuensis]KAF7994653.1 hypothetical protein HCN44_004125 [Aphidius gifuensis]